MRVTPLYDIESKTFRMELTEIHILSFSLGVSKMEWNQEREHQRDSAC